LADRAGGIHKNSLSRNPSALPDQLFGTAGSPHWFRLACPKYRYVSEISAGNLVAEGRFHESMVFNLGSVPDYRAMAIPSGKRWAGLQ